MAAPCLRTVPPSFPFTDRVVGYGRATNDEVGIAAMHHLLQLHVVDSLCFKAWVRVSYSSGDGFSVDAIRLLEGHQHSHLNPPFLQSPFLYTHDRHLLSYARCS